MDADAIATLLGQRASEPRVESVLRRCGVARRPAVEVDPDDADGPVVKSQAWVSNFSIGIEFGFEEEGSFMGLDHADRGVGPMVLTEIYFYGQRPGVRPYPHALPFGLSLNDSRSVVRGKMARLEHTRRSYVRDTWEYQNYRLTVSYADEDARIDFVVCILPAEPPEPFEGGTATLPSITTMISLLNKNVNDDALRRTFVPLGLDRQRLTAHTEQMVDFRRTYGFKLAFRVPDKTPRATPSLHQIEFMRAGELESRGWRGDLPFGIRFDDSPEAVFRKVPHPPTNQDDQDFVGQAFWELPEYSLLVVYSTMENIVLRASVFAPQY